MTSPLAHAAARTAFALLATLAPFIPSRAAEPKAPAVDIRYEYGPDSVRKEGVPQGTITEHEWTDSKIFPGTLRRYWIYVPAQYDPAKPAALMVFQDGHAYIRERGEFRTPIVLDNLIHEGSMPVTIGVFVDPGTTQPELPPKPGWEPKPENRAVEYDTMSPAYADFLITEILPEVKNEYNITDDPDGHAIGGISSGGIAAFTAAWERPDAFRKVLSHVGSFTNIRGGDRYPGMIRKGYDKRPMRIFLQDGSHDLDNAHGSWWLGNLQMDAALKFAEYDYKFVAGEGAHNGNHGGAIMPDSLRWLWRDYKLPE
ncbi:alpha/beta hydrolase [Lacipirellula sp.]|uniref:alpha/beta hydrolase n=1 Tax=Lacipirellula sp. TaxID=2691419 RepID=UPI003D105925